MYRIDPPPGYGLDGRSLIADALYIDTTVEARTIAGGRVVSGGAVSFPPKKRGRKKKNSIQTANSSQNSLLPDSQPPAVMRPRTAYSLFAHQVLL